MPLTDAQRQQIVTEAATWIGTPYRAHSCCKGPRGGTDCGQLAGGVFKNCGLLPEDLALPTDYSVNVSQHQESTEFVETVATYMDEIEESVVRPGDIVVYQLRNSLAYCHAAIVIEWPRCLIHCIGRGVQKCGDNSPLFRNALKKFFTLRLEEAK